MATAVEVRPKPPWSLLAWVGLLLLVCYAPVMRSLIRNWYLDDDMGHGYFVPVIAGFIVWQRRDELLALKPRPSWWGLPLLLLGGALLIGATLGVELFTSRIALMMTLTGTILLLGGKPLFKKLTFPLFLLLFMIPIPTIAYTRITLPLQHIATSLAAAGLTLIGIPVHREGNVIELASGSLTVVEACSGIRSLLSLTFLSLVYGYFCEKRVWVRWVLFFSTIPIAILANGTRVTVTGVLSEVKREYAEGFFHESTGMVITMLALCMMVGFHLLLRRIFPGEPAAAKAAKQTS
jgi:exosortase